jgi:hypothetical protein
LLYDDRGGFVAVEEDADGDGVFVRLAGAAADAARAGVTKR